MAAAERMVDFSRFFFLGKMLNIIWTLSFREKTFLRNFAKKQEERLLIFRVLVPHTVLHMYLGVINDCIIAYRIQTFYDVLDVLL